MLYGNIDAINTYTISEIKNIIQATDKAFGCCQWKSGRSAQLLELYDKHHVSNSSNYSFAEAAAAEKEMLLMELDSTYYAPDDSFYNYTYVYREWKEDCELNNVAVDSLEAASLACYRIVMGFGYSTRRQNESTAHPSWIADAQNRTNYAKDIYRVMLGLQV